VKVTDAIQQMRDSGYSEEDIFKAVAKKPEMVARYKAEREEALLSRKLPGGMEDLAGQARQMSEETGPSLAKDLKAGAEGAADVVGRIGNALVPGGLYNRAVNAMDGDTSGQERLPAPVRIGSDVVGGLANPVNLAAASIGQKLAQGISAASPTAQGFAQGIGRFLTKTGAGAVGAGTAGVLGQGAEEGLEGYRPGWLTRTGQAGTIGAALGRAGGALESAGAGLQNTKGARARQYAKVGEEEAKRIVAAGPPPPGSEGYRRFAEAEDILNMPQGGKAARFGMDLENEARHPGVADAYAAADARARASVPVTAADGEANPMRVSPPMVDVTGLSRELRGVGPDGRVQMRAPEVEAQMAKYSALMERFGAKPGPDGAVLMPADRVNELKKIIGAKGAYENMPGVLRSDFAGADAQARAANSQFYGEADRLKMQQEIDRERARVAMGLRDEPSVAREHSDAARLQSYLQPQLHGGHYGMMGNVTANAQAISGTAPIQSIARFMSGAGQRLARPQLAPAASEALQNWVAQRRRKSAIIDTIFSKKPGDSQQEDTNGVRQ